MKKNYYPVLSGMLLGIIVFLVILLAHQHDKYEKFIAENCIEDECMHIVWNDDDESIPTVGSLVEVEFIDAGCVYIGPVN